MRAYYAFTTHPLQYGGSYAVLQSNPLLFVYSNTTAGEANRMAIVGPWNGEEGITLMADLDAGATGAMTGAGYPDGIRQIMDPFAAGDREAAVAAYQRWLPLINYENRQCGLSAAKVLMQEGGVIRSEMTRHPVLPLHPATRAGLIEVARRTDPLVLRWSR